MVCFGRLPTRNNASAAPINVGKTGRYGGYRCRRHLRYNIGFLAIFAVTLAYTRQPPDVFPDFPCSG
jgi:hypothetical protein